MSKSNQKFLYYGHQSLDQTDLSWIKKALNSDWLTTGPFVENFEARIAKYVGAKYAVACSNGTAALFLLTYLCLDLILKKSFNAQYDFYGYCECC